MKRTMVLTQGAVIAAVYFALCMLVAPVAWGPIQFRVSEALMILPALTPAAVPGLFAGCLLFNILNPAALGPVDILFGSLATLLAAWLTRRLETHRASGLRSLPFARLKTWLLPLPAVLVNGLIVGGYLLFLLPGSVVTLPAVLLNMLSIAVCEALVVYPIGLPLLMVLRRSETVLRLCGVRES